MLRAAVRSPEDLALAAAPPDIPARRRIVGLDLGTSCGLAIFDFTPVNDGYENLFVVLGQIELSIGPYDSGGVRIVRLLQCLDVLQPQLIMFEDVKFKPGAEMQGQSIHAILARAATSMEFLGGLKHTVMQWAHVNNVPAEGLPIAGIKQFATGKGNASKVDMVKATNERFGLHLPTDEKEALSQGADNIADAAFCGAIGLDRYAGTLRYANARTADSA